MEKFVPCGLLIFAGSPYTFPVYLSHGTALAYLFAAPVMDKMPFAVYHRYKVLQIAIMVL